MARKPVTIPIATDTRDFARGVKAGVVEPLDDMVDALKDADAAADDTGDALVDSMRDAQRATEDLDDEQRKLRDTLEEGSRAGFKGFAKNAGDGMDRAGDATNEYKEEAISNFSEVASSFTGDMSSAVDLVQGTLGGLAGSIPGGVGLALGGLAAVAGTVAAAWQKAAEETEARIGAMYDDMSESGKDFLTKEFIAAEINKIITETDGAAIGYKRLKKLAEDSGVAESDLLLAFGGDIKKRRELVKELSGDYSDLSNAVERAGDGVETAADRELIARADIIKRIKEQNGETGKATEKVQAQREAISKLNATQGRMYEDALRNQGEAIDNLTTIKEATEGIPTKVTTKVNVTTNTKDLVKDIQSALKGQTFTIPINVKGRGGQRVQ